jgi:aminoglycoside phosphotransferase
VPAGLPEDAICAVPPCAREARARLRQQGFRPVLRLAHAPDIQSSRYVFPLRGPQAAFALQLVPLSTTKRAGARLLARVGAFPSTTDVFRRVGARPLLSWLAALRERRDTCSAVIVQSWRADGDAVVFRFATAPTPDLVVKIGPQAAAEAAGLRDVAPSAAAAGADVPVIVTDGVLGDAPMVAQTFVGGRSAFERVRGSAARAESVLRALAEWLERWNAATTSARPFGVDDADRLIRRAAVLGGDVEAETRRVTGRCLGSAIPLVAAHNDLTAVNVLVGGRHGPGVVDWGVASGESLPLGDLAYAAADLEAAVDGYRDRVEAFRRGALAGPGSELLERAARRLALDDEAVELCLHACWLQHAANEPEPGPFREILRRASAR